MIAATMARRMLMTVIMTLKAKEFCNSTMLVTKQKSAWPSARETYTDPRHRKRGVWKDGGGCEGEHQGRCAVGRSVEGMSGAARRGLLLRYAGATRADLSEELGATVCKRVLT